MALSALNWRYVGVRTFTAGSLTLSHDAVYDLGTAATYADVAAGKYRGKEAEKDRLEGQIFEATRDGRVR